MCKAVWLIYVLLQVSNVQLLSGIADHVEYGEDDQPLVCTGISGTLPLFTEFLQQNHCAQISLSAECGSTLQFIKYLK